MPDNETQPIVELTDVSVHFTVRNREASGQAPRILRALDKVSLRVEPGTCFGLVGESGSGKSTLAKVVMGMIKPTNGRVTVAGVDPHRVSQSELRQHRRRIQTVFQDPYSSLDPRMRVGRIIAEPLFLFERVPPKQQRDKRVRQLLDEVGLPAASADKFPHQFSGGQRQRIAIARALVSEPRLIVLDEPTSALDVSIQAQILNLLADLQKAKQLSYILISHDLTTVAQMSSAVGVMYLGRIVETGPTAEVYHAPSHPYTQALLASVPRGDELAAPRLRAGYEPPSAMDVARGCSFRNACLLRETLGNPQVCVDDEPALADVAPRHQAACHFRDRGRDVAANIEAIAAN